MHSNETPVARAAGHEAMVSIERCMAEAVSCPVDVSHGQIALIAALRETLNARAEGLMGVDRPRAIVLADMARSEACEDSVLAGYVLPIMLGRRAWLTRPEAVDWLRVRWQRSVERVNTPKAAIG